MFFPHLVTWSIKMSLNVSFCHWKLFQSWMRISLSVINSSNISSYTQPSAKCLPWARSSQLTSKLLLMLPHDTMWSHNVFVRMKPNKASRESCSWPLQVAGSRPATEAANKLKWHLKFYFLFWRSTLIEPEDRYLVSLECSLSFF